MLIKQTTISECWCPKCGKGQMEFLLDKSFKEKIAIKELIGLEVACENCGEKNIIEDVLHLIPSMFYIMSDSDLSKVKSNQDLKKWLDK